MRRDDLLTSGLRDTILGHCAAVKGEACGLLAGHADPLSVVSVRACRNAAADVVHTFEIAPAELLDAAVSAADRGLELVGGYHSHPAGCSRPTSTDLLGNPPGWVTAIVADGHVHVWLSGGTI